MHQGTEQAVGVVRRAYELVADGRMAEALDLLAPDVVWEPSEAFPDRETFEGHRGVLRYIEMFQAGFDDFWMRPDEYIVIDEHIVVPLHIGGRAKRGGIDIDAAFVHVWTIRDGLVTHVRTYLDKGAALAALADEA